MMFISKPTHREFGSNNQICYHGVNDSMRMPKYAAAMYASQRETPYMEVLSMMHIGERASGQIKDVIVATNADYIELYKNDVLIGSFTAQNSPYRALPHPPIVNLCLKKTQIESKNYC